VEVVEAQVRLALMRHQAVRLVLAVRVTLLPFLEQPLITLEEVVVVLQMWELLAQVQVQQAEAVLAPIQILPQLLELPI
jgi:hypothetical protein